MTRIICEEVTSRLTDLDEGILPLGEALRVRLHLIGCPECRKLRVELRRMPEMVRRASGSEAPSLLPIARTALRAALVRAAGHHPVRRPQALPVSREIQDLLRSGADPALRLMELVHQAFAKGTAPLSAPFLPEAVMSQLPPPETWTWKSRGGSRIASLIDAGGDSPRLSLLVAPRGFRTPPHVHFGSEQMLVLDGLLEDGQAAYPTGQWVHFGRGSAHAPLVLNDECWCLIRDEGTIRYTGPFGWLRNLLAA